MSDDRKRDSAREIREMEQIEQGLERFLQQELQGMEGSGQPARRESQFYDFDLRDTWDEEEEEFTEELEDEFFEEEAFGGSRARQHDAWEDEEEDWDSPRQRRLSGSTSQGSRGRISQNSGRTKSAGGSQRSRAVEQPGGTRRAQGTERTGKSRSRSTADAEDAEFQASQNSRRKEKPRKKRKKSRLRRFLITVALIIALLGAAQYYLVGVVYSRMTYKESENAGTAPIKENGVVNILLIGNDSRENGEDGRSDAMILLSISDKTKKIYMTSLLRDMYVEIPGHDGNRLNAAYSFGGAELLMETIERNLDIRVDHYVLVNFEAFANLVDAVDGVELELTSEEVEYVNAYLWEYNILTERPEGTDYMDTSLSGMIHLNGPQALAYSRNRYLGTDFGRTERQRKVLSAVIKKLPSAMGTNPKGLVDGLMPNLTTNLTQGECYRLSFMAGKFLTYEIVQNSIPLEGTYKNASIRGMAVLEVDYDANKQYLQENIYGVKPNAP